MARSNLAYQLEVPKRSYDAQPIARPRPKLRTIEGQGRATAAQTQQAPWLRTLAIMSTLVLIVLASTSVMRVSVANATVQMMQASEETTAAIEQARAAGLELEVLHSIANNPTRIQDAAANMGILPASQPATVTALSGFTAETQSQMQAAASEVQASQLALLTADEPGDIKAPAAVSATDDAIVSEEVPGEVAG